MSNEVYEALARSASGFVESPAGCGKTEAIVRTVSHYCDGCQLVLTHTHAGVDALRERFKDHRVARAKYHVDTIAGWSWGWVRMYPSNARYIGPTDIADWSRVYSAMRQLLQKDFVRSGILNSYRGIIVDEYQDCTVPMHQLIVELKRLLPCRVLGDELQGVFGFRDDALVTWADVRAEFASDLGALDTPHRWIKAGHELLGRWLLNNRALFRQEREPDYGNSPISCHTTRYAELSRQLVRTIYEKQGRVCIIGPKMRRLPAGIETALVNQRFRVLEPNDLTALRELIETLAQGQQSDKAIGIIEFFKAAFGGFADYEQSFFHSILTQRTQRVRRGDRKTLCDKHTEGATPRLLLDLLAYAARRDDMPCKLKDSVSALSCILEQHVESGVDLRTLYAGEISKRQYQSRSKVHRCIGSTLLVKGLEFDHAIVVRAPNWQKSWGNYKDLYVALTRGAKSATVLDLAA
jgi:AAA domain